MAMKKIVNIPLKSSSEWKQYEQMKKNMELIIFLKDNLHERCHNKELKDGK